MADKKLTIFAGVNGAGKSTLYKATSFMIDNKIGLINETVLEFFGERINTDEIVEKIGSWKSSIDQIQAARIAVKMRESFFEKGVSFNQETTLTGNTILKTISEAKEKGYKVILNYVGVDSPEIAKERVKNRVLNGGHDIPEKVIEKRYYESIENLKKIIKLVDIGRIYDNTSHPSVIFKIENGKLINLEKKIPKWLENLKIEEKSNKNSKYLINVIKNNNKKNKEKGNER